MSYDIVLTSALRHNIQSLHSKKGGDSARMAEGKTDNASAKDNPDSLLRTATQDFFSHNMSAQASTLSELLDNISRSAKILDHASRSVAALSTFIQEAQTHALEIRDAYKDGGSFDLEAHQRALEDIQSRIDNVVEKAAYSGTNLLAGNDLETRFTKNERHHVITQGIDLVSDPLALDDLDFASLEAAEESIDYLRSALDEIMGLKLDIASDLNVVRTRRDFTQETVNALEDGVNGLALTTLSEEGANLLALQTRQTLSSMSLSLASPSQDEILRLF
ncbi:MAG: hypothetical protein ACLFP8_01305 [Alphaproteobacteria bacterium]